MLAIILNILKCLCENRLALTSHETFFNTKNECKSHLKFSLSDSNCYRIELNWIEWNGMELIIIIEMLVLKPFDKLWTTVSFSFFSSDDFTIKIIHHSRCLSKTLLGCCISDSIKNNKTFISIDNINRKCAYLSVSVFYRQWKEKCQK